MRHSWAASQSGSQAPCQMGYAAVDTAKSAPLSPSRAARRSSPAAAAGSWLGMHARPTKRWGLLLQKSAAQSL